MVFALNGVPVYPAGTIFTPASERTTLPSGTPPLASEPLDPLVVPPLPLLLAVPLLLPIAPLLAVAPLLVAVPPLLAPLVEPELAPPSSWEELVLDVPQ